MSRTIGFRRNIYLSWLDATAAFCAETDDIQTIRARLDPIVEQQVANKANRQDALHMLLHIWVGTGERYPALRDEALHLFGQAETSDDRIWLHYGMTSLCYGFFRMTAVAIGQSSRHKDTWTTADIKKRIFAEVGQLGGVDKATERVVFSLRDWGVLDAGERRYSYAPLPQRLRASHRAIEQWALAAALVAHPAEEVSFTDLVRLPELFPFHFTVGIDELRRSQHFEVYRQSAGWDMVRLADARLSLAPVSV